MKQKQVPIKQTILQSHNYDALMAAYSSDEITQRSLVFLEETVISSVINISEFEDKICLGRYILKPRFVKKYWVQYKADSGMTYNKKTKTVKMWFGKQLYTTSDPLANHFYDFMVETVNMNFIQKDLFTALNPSVKTINRILKGKITNPKDFIASVFRDRHPGVNVSKELLWQVYNSNYSNVITNILRPNVYVVQTCENIDRYLAYVLSGALHGSYSLDMTMKDLSAQAMALNKKFSYCWSPKRLQDVHSELSREIAIEKFKSVPFIDYEYKGKFPESDFLELLTNNREVFAEGNIMSHCVYGSYESSIRNKTYFVLKYEDDNGVRGTVGIRKSFGSNYYTVDQFYGKKNSIINPEIHDYVNQFVARVDVQDFFAQNTVADRYTTDVLDNILGTIRVEPIF